MVTEIKRRPKQTVSDTQSDSGKDKETCRLPAIHKHTDRYNRHAYTQTSHRHTNR